MKKAFRTLSLAAASIMAVSLAGCSKTGQSTPGSDPSSKIDPESISFDWQEAYESKIGEFAASSDFSDDSAFDIIDVTADGIPELIISPNTEPGTSCTIYTIDGDLTLEVGSAGYNGIFTYNPESGTIKDEYIGSGFVIGKIMEYKNHELTPVLTYSDNSASASMGASIKHEINGEEVLLGDYEKAVAPYLNTGNIEVGRRYTFGDSAVKYAVHYADSWVSVMAPYQKDLCKKKLRELMGYFAEIPDTHPAFDFCDMNGDKIPEMIVSQGIDEADGCTVYYFSDEAVVNMEGSYGSSGYFSFDTIHYVFFGSKQGKKTYWSIANSSFSANDYKESDSIAAIGRKYLLTEEGINEAFN